MMMEIFLTPSSGLMLPILQWTDVGTNASTPLIVQVTKETPPARDAKSSLEERDFGQMEILVIHAKPKFLNNILHRLWKLGAQVCTHRVSTKTVPSRQIATRALSA